MREAGGEAGVGSAQDFESRCRAHSGGAAGAGAATAAGATANVSSSS